MAFLESPRFPDNISYGSSGGPMYKTEVVTVYSGFEYNNISWEESRHKYDASMGVRSEGELSQLIKFFHVTRGKGHRFRYKDWSDYKACDLDETSAFNDMVFGTGDSVTTEFQLIKVYDMGSMIGVSYNQRDIKKPVQGTILIGVNGILQTETTDYSIDYTTGIVTFVSPPANGVPITWGGEFDVPCRFDTDELPLSLDFYGYASGSVPIIEVRI
jgi:uncharacterized protein (TIGR02217 family)